MDELDRGRDVRRLDIDLQQRPVIDPGFVLHLDRIVAEPDDEIGGAQELALAERPCLQSFSRCQAARPCRKVCPFQMVRSIHGSPA